MITFSFFHIPLTVLLPLLACSSTTGNTASGLSCCSCSSSCLFIVAVPVPSRLVAAVCGAAMSVDLAANSSARTTKGLTNDIYRHNVILWHYIAGRWKNKFQNYQDIFKERENQF